MQCEPEFQTKHRSSCKFVIVISMEILFQASNYPRSSLSRDTNKKRNPSHILRKESSHVIPCESPHSIQSIAWTEKRVFVWDCQAQMTPYDVWKPADVLCFGLYPEDTMTGMPPTLEASIRGIRWQDEDEVKSRRLNGRLATSVCLYKS